MSAYSFKRQFVHPICVGLGIRCPAGFEIEDREVMPKLQTIRAGVIRLNGQAWSKAEGGRAHAKAGGDLQLYFGMRTKVCKLIGRSMCIGVSPITMEIGATVDQFSVILDGRLLSRRKLRDLARADGFALIEDMAKFWRDENDAVGKKWSGVLIRWEPN